jgi:glycine oxidase
MTTDFLIIGQGLAGSLLAWFLVKKGASVIILDAGKGGASGMAGGVYNPVTGRMLLKSWLADDLVPFAEETYQELETELQAQFQYRTGIYKMLNSGKEREEVESEIGRTGSFFKSVSDEDLPGIKGTSFGMVEIFPAGFVKTDVFLSLLREWLIKKAAYKKALFDYADLKLQDNGVKWKDITAKQVIFCEGHYGIHNPWFQWVPYKLAKGELITIKAKGLYSEKIVSHNGILIPLGNDTFRFGGTFEWEDLSLRTTEKGLQQLLEKLKDLVTVPFEVINHEAGIRPSVKNRRPWLGRHPQHSQLSVFNGLGTKGVLLAPFFASQLADYLTEGKPLMKEVDVSNKKSFLK